MEYSEMERDNCFLGFQAASPSTSYTYEYVLSSPYNSPLRPRGGGEV
jgi:hypothetical protein